VTHFPRSLILGHPALAGAGLASWVIFLLTHRGEYAWAGFALLAAAALAGFMLLTRWLGQGRHARTDGRHLPVRVLAALHGSLALTTFALVLVTATLASQPP
jgi:hypothetical protein